MNSFANWRETIRFTAINIKTVYPLLILSENGGKKKENVKGKSEIKFLGDVF